MVFSLDRLLLSSREPLAPAGPRHGRVHSEMGRRRSSIERERARRQTLERCGICCTEKRTRERLAVPRNVCWLFPRRSCAALFPWPSDGRGVLRELALAQNPSRRARPIRGSQRQASRFDRGTRIPISPNTDRKRTGRIFRPTKGSTSRRRVPVETRRVAPMPA